MNCACGGEGRVLETRSRQDGSLRRARKCEKCGERWATIEARVPARPRGAVHVLIISDGELHDLRKGINALQLVFDPRVRLELKPERKEFQGPGTSGHPADCRCAACRNFDD